MVEIADGSTAMVMYILLVASIRDENHQKRSPDVKVMAKTVKQFFLLGKRCGSTPPNPVVPEIPIVPAQTR